MADFLVGIVILVAGLGVCFLGLRLWFVLLPVWGFVAGFFLGATAITGLFGDGFLGTVSGWVVGLVVGVVFAVLSYILWYVGALIAAGSVGALVGDAVMSAFNVDTSWVVFIVSLGGAILFALGALLLNLPVYIVLFNSALAGAAGAVTGAMLVLNRIDRADLDLGAGWAMIEESWFWFLVWVVVAALGIGYQMTMLTQATFPENRWIRGQPAGAL